MATNVRFMPVPPAAVWDALADPAGYGDWVVGSKLIRDADPSWPAPGSRFFYTIGIGPLKVSDQTESLEAEAPWLLRMRAKARPYGAAQVTMEMTPDAGGTVVRMTENPDGLMAVLALNPLFQLATKARNAESLARLERLALRKSR